MWPSDVFVPRRFWCSLICRGDVTLLHAGHCVTWVGTVLLRTWTHPIVLILFPLEVLTVRLFNRVYVVWGDGSSIDLPSLQVGTHCKSSLILQVVGALLRLRVIFYVLSLFCRSCSFCWNYFAFYSILFYMQLACTLYIAFFVSVVCLVSSVFLILLLLQLCLFCFTCWCFLYWLLLCLDVLFVVCVLALHPPQWCCSLCFLFRVYLYYRAGKLFPSCRHTSPANNGSGLKVKW